MDPKTHALASITGFSVSPAKGEGHGAGTISADSGGGFIFATDRNRGVVNIVDPAKKQLVATAKLSGGPDYVRWVEPLGEVWVTEPGRKAIEVFQLEASSPPKLVATRTIEFPDGPESLVVDLARGTCRPRPMPPVSRPTRRAMPMYAIPSMASCSWSRTASRPPGSSRAYSR